MVLAATPTELEINKNRSDIARQRTENGTKPRVEDYELADLGYSPSFLNTFMYREGYMRRNRGWELDPKKLRDKARVGLTPGPSFVKDEAEREAFNKARQAAAVTDVAAATPDSEESPVMATVVKKPATSKSPQSSPPPVTDTSENLEDLKTQMRDTAVGLGINPKSAAAMSNFLVGSFDVQNPEALWAGLSEVTEIHPSMRKRFWRTWASLIGVGVPGELIQKVDQQTNSAMGRKEDIPGLKKRYVAVDGEVLDADPEDDSGMSFSQALQLARLQNEKSAAELGAGVSEKEATLSTALSVISEANKSNTATLVELLRSKDGSSSGNSELVLKLIEAKNEAAEARLLGVIQESNRTVGEALKGIAEAMRAMATGQATRKSWFEEAMVEVPELRDKFFKNIFGNGNDGMVRIQMPGATGVDGQPAGVPLEAYMRLEEINSRKETVKALREGMPDLVKLGERIVGALQTNAEAQKIAAERGIALGSGKETEKAAPTVTETVVKETSPAPQQQEFDPETMDLAKCSGCGSELAYPKGVKSFGCPQCNTTMTVPEQTEQVEYDPRNNPPARQRARIRPIIRHGNA